MPYQLADPNYVYNAVVGQQIAYSVNSVTEVYGAASYVTGYYAPEVVRMCKKCDALHDWRAQSAGTAISNVGDPSWTVQFTTFAQNQYECLQQMQALDQETIDRLTREREERRIKVEAAASRAEELLFTFIGEDRKKQYAEFGHFDVPVNGKLYRIRKGRSNNVLLLENGEPKIKYCAHPSDAVPDGDTMLAQFLMLTSDEKRFLALANKTPCSNDDGAFDPAAIPNIPEYPTIPDPAGLGPDMVPDMMAYMEERAFAQVQLAA